MLLVDLKKSEIWTVSDTKTVPASHYQHLTPPTQFCLQESPWSSLVSSSSNGDSPWPFVVGRGTFLVGNELYFDPFSMFTPLYFPYAR